MADLIDRQAAIELCDWYQHEFCECDYAFGELANELHKLPPADVQPVRHGYWIEDRYNDLDFVCSECGEPCANMVMGMPRDRYCKWCGARMDFEKGDKEK